MIRILIKMLRKDLKFSMSILLRQTVYEADYDAILAQLQSEMAG